MLNFTKCIEEFNRYNGSEKKKTLIYNDKRYLVKFPSPTLENNNNILFINNTISEYIGSNIFKLIGINSQNTILGIYEYNGKEKIVCGCEDFTNDDLQLYEFESLALSTNPDKKIDTELNDILEVINISNLKNKEEIKSQFFDMFIVDSLIGNTDRHNGNWGFLLNKKTNELQFSPIYDCGSCLNPILDEKEIEKLTITDLKNLALNCYSCLKENGKKINYMEYLKNANNINCNKAILKIFPKINIDEINLFIDGIEYINVNRKNFYKKIISIRYEYLKSVYNILIN
jgi:hypothetical protein